MASTSPSPRSPEISEKSKKYDRQLRLWGDHGQARLEKSHVCLINANATGTEILKSLVLPGVGSFTIVDGHKVTQEDVGNNFFLDPECLGKSRAECATRFLLEMNPDVSGEAIEEHPDVFFRHNPTILNQFSVVIGSEISERVLTSISQVLWENGIPLVYVHSVGFLGWMRIQANEVTIVESHPDSSKEDLRLDVPFPELVHHMDNIKVNSRDVAMKTPWLVLLYKGIQDYMKSGSTNGESMDVDISSLVHPCHMSSKEKRAFKEFLGNYLVAIGLTISDEEYDEVMKSVNSALVPTKINSDILSILADPKATKPENSKFWVMCGALKEFVDAHGCLPLRGSLPDMIAETDQFIQLQNIYKEKASKDAEDVLGRCQQLLKQAGLHGISIVEDDVKLFCKESQNLRVVRGYPIYKELQSPPTDILQELAQNTEDCDQLKMFYVLMRAMMKFHSDYNAYPGLLDHDVEPDINRFKGTLNKLQNEWNANISAKEDCIHELCRYGACELPSVAAFMGGCAAHEVIKLITKQYVPLDNTLIYSALQSTTLSFKVPTP